MTVANNVTIDESTANQIIVDAETANLVAVRTGAVPSVAVVRRYIHVQSVPATTWAIVHDLGGKPSVTIVDTSDTHVVGDVTYNSTTSITAAFTAAFAGYAYLT
jgi:hypothetical protein